MGLGKAVVMELAAMHYQVARQFFISKPMVGQEVNVTQSAQSKPHNAQTQD